MARRQTLLAAKRQAKKFATAYMKSNPDASAAEVKAATRADLKAAGFDPSFWIQLIEWIVELIKNWRENRKKAMRRGQ